MVKVISPEDRKKIEAAKKIDSPKFRLTFKVEPTVKWINVIQPGIFSVVVELEDIVEDPDSDEDYLEALGSYSIPHAAVIARYVEEVLASGCSLHSYIYEDLGVGDHIEFTDLEVEDEPI